MLRYCQPLIDEDIEIKVANFLLQLKSDKIYHSDRSLVT